jgi:hypothetical protein
MASLLHGRLSAGELPAQEARMLIGEQHKPLEPSDATAISYTLLRHLGFMLDELSAQGLTLWQDERHAWRWSWATTALQAERGFWALGEAIVDAVVTRYPATFDAMNVPMDTAEGVGDAVGTITSG